MAGGVGALAYHPSQHMLALSSFGSCQPLLVLNHLKGGAVSQPKAMPTRSLGGGASLGVPKGAPTTGGKEGEEGGGVVTTSASERGSSLSLGGLAGMAASQPFKNSRKFSDLVKTLDRVTATTKS